MDGVRFELMTMTLHLYLGESGKMPRHVAAVATVKRPTWTQLNFNVLAAGYRGAKISRMITTAKKTR